ncbi:porin family protein [Mangrovibacterium lignilyticum]|uniref:hypothetical protein n=1 Tax=Mangrovibacterium lignilyticum TaxID=2668052 RepID=UPI0013D1D9D8|nr:hypothetical protein [Mangrovibacterium lignilyticum]
MKRNFFYLCFLSLFLTSGFQTFAQESKIDTVIVVESSIAHRKEEKNRNVMLNADAATGPREVNIGLPFRGDIVILENGVPVVFSFWPTMPTFAWNVDNSLGRMGLLSFEEGALLYGKVGFAVQSYDRDPGRKFQGYASAFMSSVGSSRFDMTVTGPIGKKGWGYMASAYQSFDRGYGTNLMYTPWDNKTSNAKFAISKRYKKGSVKLLYKYVETQIGATAYFPVTYKGDGEVEEYPGFRLGKDSYFPRNGMIPYRDVMGDAQWANLTKDKFSKSKSHNIYLMGDHRFDNGWKLDYSALYQNMKSPLIIEFPLSLMIWDTQEAPYSYMNFYKAGSSDVYEGRHVQMMYNQLMPQSDCKYFVTRFEMNKKIKNHSVRIGATYQNNNRQYTTFGGAYLMSVEPNPVLLSMSPNDDTVVFGGAWGSISHDKYSRTALYASDDFNVGSRLGLSLGARLEHQNYTDYHNPYVNNEGLEDKELIKKDFNNKFNKVGYAKLVYKLTNGFGFVGDISYNSENKAYWDYTYRDAEGKAVDENGLTASEGGHPRTTEPGSYETAVTKMGGGVYLNIGKKLSVVSMITSIKKNEVPGAATLDDPSGSGLRADFGPEFYNIETMGWSTDITAEPFRNFNIHYLLTLQNPQYKDYEVNGFGQTLSYSDKTIPALSKVLMEIDPSYMFAKGKLKAWVSLRYFGKQYSNETNAFSWNPWWENFGGLDYMVNRKLTLKLQVVNFLDQSGVKGAIQGGSQINSDADYIGKPIVANAIRPRTVELKVDFKF